jgi:hypothetical protein
MHTYIRPAAILLTLAASASAAPIATITLVNGNDSGADLPFNTTEFRLSNVSTAGEAITGMTMTVGDTVWNFDNIYLSQELFTGGNGTETATLLVGDRTDGGAVTDLFTYAFTNFNPGVIFRGQFDIDNDNGSFPADARLVLFNNGAAPNAVLTLDFSGGTAIDFTLPDGPADLDSYTFTIPTPGAAMLGGVACLFAARRSRSHSKA